MEQWVEEKEDERQLKIANGEIQEDSEEVSIDLTAPASSEDSSGTAVKESDVLSFDKFENPSTSDDENVTYIMDDDLDLGEDTIGDKIMDANKVEETVDDIVEIKNET